MPLLPGKCEFERKCYLELDRRQQAENKDSRRKKSSRKTGQKNKKKEKTEERHRGERHEEQKRQNEQHAHTLSQAARLITPVPPAREAWLSHSFRAAFIFTEGGGPATAREAWLSFRWLFDFF